MPEDRTNDAASGEHHEQELRESIERHEADLGEAVDEFTTAVKATVSPASYVRRRPAAWLLGASAVGVWLAARRTRHERRQGETSMKDLRDLRDLRDLQDVPLKDLVAGLFDTRRSTGMSFGAFATGVIAGAGLALMLAPRAAAEARETLGEKLEEARERFNEARETIGEKLDETVRGTGTGAH